MSRCQGVREMPADRFRKQGRNRIANLAPLGCLAALEDPGIREGLQPGRLAHR